MRATPDATWSVTPGYLGDAIMVAAMDVPPDQEDRFNTWYTHEHLPERLEVEGIHRARRYRRSEDSGGTGLRYLTIYESDDTSVFSGPQYLWQVNNPTPLTQEVIRARQASGSTTARTVLRVSASYGAGIGRSMSFVEFSPAASGLEGFVDWFTRDFAPRLLAHTELCGLHLVVADEESTDAKRETRDGRAFGKTASIADHALIVEGTHDVAGLVDRLVMGDDGLPGQDVRSLDEPTYYDYLLSMTAPPGQSSRPASAS